MGCLLIYLFYGIISFCSPNRHRINCVTQDRCEPLVVLLPEFLSAEISYEPLS